MSMDLLSQVRSHCVIDIDSMDPQVASKYAVRGKFSDMTSNQAIVYFHAIRPECLELLKNSIHFVKKQQSEDFEVDVIDVFTVLLAKEVYPYLYGSVHAQVSPSAAYDADKTINHARKLLALFEVHGIPRDRVCFKIPATPESMIACKYLSSIGIRTLATTLFSLPQAIAASQAGCTYVAPYVNELRVHFEPNLWNDYDIPAQEHPMSLKIREIVAVFTDVGSKTLVMPASIVTAKEVVGLVTLQPDHLTLSASVLEQLAKLPAVDDSILSDRLSPPSVKGAWLELYKEMDFLASGGSLLRQALLDDKDTSRKLADALELFQDCEEKTKSYIRALNL